MRWIHDFDLFLFDFDGTLVQTEHLHYQAYKNILERRGHRLLLSFNHFLALAHLNSTAWKEALYVQIPNLDTNWQSLYDEKVKEYLELIVSGKVDLMPGVEKILNALVDANKRICVVTNSVLSQVELIRSQISILKAISHWVTREEYEKPKPDPECYLKAIQLYGKMGDRIIGFEDSVRGLISLRKTSAFPVLICPKHYPLLEVALEGGGKHFESLEDCFLVDHFY